VRFSKIESELTKYMPTSSSAFDELAHAGPEHLDPGYIATYDRKAATNPTDDVELLRSLGLKASSTLVFSFDPAQAESAIEAWLTKAPSRPEEGWTRDELETHLRTEYSTFCWLLEPILSHAGFHIPQVEYGGLGIHAAYVCRAGASPRRPRVVRNGTRGGRGRPTSQRGA
jgi:hypothetical protein